MLPSSSSTSSASDPPTILLFPRLPVEHHWVLPWHRRPSPSSIKPDCLSDDFDRVHRRLLLANELFKVTIATYITFTDLAGVIQIHNQHCQQYLPLYKRNPDPQSTSSSSRFNPTELQSKALSNHKQISALSSDPESNLDAFRYPSNQWSSIIFFELNFW